MKKLICMLLALMLVLSLCACGGEEKTGATGEGDKAAQTAGQLRVGYGKADVTPQSPVPMGGYGRSSARISQGFLSYLYVTCIAVTDADDNTLLLFGMDLCSPGEAYINYAADVASATGVPVDNIVMSASHTHSAPDYGAGDVAGVGEALQVLKKGLLKAAETAMEDRAPADISIAQVETQGMNFVRHYLMNDGTYSGANFGSAASGYKQHVKEADPILQLVKFTREGGEDIILTNFQTHPHQTGGSDKFELSADVVGEYRMNMEKDLDVNVIYFSGAGGNINSSSRIAEKNATKDFRAWGKKMAEYAQSAQYTPVSGGKVQAAKFNFEGKINHEWDAQASVCRELRTKWDQGLLTSQQLIEEAAALGIKLNSPYHAGAIASRAALPKTQSFEIWAYSFGDIGFVAAPYEMFDTSGQFIKENSPFAMTVIATLSNRANGYFPSDKTYAYGGYEVDTTKYAQGTAEELADQFISMLSSMYETK